MEALNRENAWVGMAGLLLVLVAVFFSTPRWAARQREAQRRQQLDRAWFARAPGVYENLAGNDPSEPQAALRLSLLQGQFQAVLRKLRDLNPEGAGDLRDEFLGLAEQGTVYQVSWPEKVVGWTGSELDGEKDKVLARVVDPGLGEAPRKLRIELLAWRNEKYRPVEPEDVSPDGEPTRHPSLGARNLVQIASVNLQRPKENSKGQIFLSYLTEKQDYVGEVYALREGRLLRYRWKSNVPIRVVKDQLQLVDAETNKTEHWVRKDEAFESVKAE